MPLKPKENNKSELTRKTYSENIKSYLAQLPDVVADLILCIENSMLPPEIKIRWLSRIVEDIKQNIPEKIKTMEDEIKHIPDLSSKARKEMINKYSVYGITFDEQGKIQ